MIFLLYNCVDNWFQWKTEENINKDMATISQQCSFIEICFNFSSPALFSCLAERIQSIVLALNEGSRYLVTRVEWILTCTA